MQPLSCPPEESLLVLLRGALPDSEAATIRAHLLTCEECQALVAEAARSQCPPGDGEEEDAASGPSLEPGTRIGRYTVLERVGEGGMGVVCAAYDPQLDRRVALKLVSAQARAADVEANLSSRLLLEAQAMAKLDHPNVLGVHDAGLEGSAVFLAMELVDGQTLAAWLRERKRSPAEVLAMFLQAGRGLAAAHRAGIVHRDFKPANVLVGKDGRARVTDFGLARLQPTATRERPVDEAMLHGLDPVISVSGAVMGTPAYMAPEQRRGEAVDARADQFAFCVALYEALFQSSPFGGRATLERIRAGAAAPPLPPSRRAGVSARVRRAIFRGLSPGPEARFPDMEHLVSALAGQASRRWAFLAAAGAMVVAAVVAFAGLRADPAGLCRQGARGVDEVWSEPRRTAAQGAFAQAGGALGAEAWTSTRVVLDGYAERWRTAYREACTATYDERTQTESLLDLERECLRERLESFRALADTLSAADDTVVQRAAAAAFNLHPVADCTDRPRLLRRAPPPENPAFREVIARARLVLARARPLYDTGREKQALAEIDAAAELARPAAYLPFEAEAQLIRGQIQVLGDPRAAEESLRRSATAALASAHDEIAADALVSMARVIGWHLRRPEEAFRWVELAEAAVARSGSNPARLASLHGARGSIHARAEQWKQALAAHQEALALYEKYLEPGSPLLAFTHNLLAIDLAENARLEEALRHFQTALEIRKQAQGPRHPEVVTALSNIGVVLSRLGRYAEALTVSQETGALGRQIFGPDHLQVESWDFNLAVALFSMDRDLEALEAVQRATTRCAARGRPAEMQLVRYLGQEVALLIAVERPDEALAEARRLEALATRALSKGDPELVRVARALGSALSAKNQHAAAVAVMERALGAAGEAKETDRLEALDLMEALGRAFLRAGLPSRALPVLERVLASYEKQVGLRHPLVADALHLLARAHQALGAPARARPLLERAFAIQEALQPGPVTAGRLALALAQSLWSMPADRPRAKRLAATALRGLTLHTPRASRLRLRLRDWLANPE